MSGAIATGLSGTDPFVYDPVYRLLNLAAEAYRSAMAAETQSSPDRDAFSDEALVESIVSNGSQQHFRALMARYKTRVHHLALSVLGPGKQAMAEDAAQEIFIKLYQRLGSFRGDSKFSTWLYRIAINTAIDFKRSNARHEHDELSEHTIPEALQGAPISIEDRDQAEAVQKAIAKLPQAQRMMVYQYYWLDLKMREIAEILGCPEGTVKVYLLRARKALADQLGAPGND